LRKWEEALGLTYLQRLDRKRFAIAEIELVWAAA
jgi:hypothetical protein